MASWRGVCRTVENFSRKRQSVEVRVRCRTCATNLVTRRVGAKGDCRIDAAKLVGRDRLFSRFVFFEPAFEQGDGVAEGCCVGSPWRVVRHSWGRRNGSSLRSFLARERGCFFLHRNALAEGNAKSVAWHFFVFSKIICMQFPIPFPVPVGQHPLKVQKKAEKVQKRLAIGCWPSALVARGGARHWAWGEAAIT